MKRYLYTTFELAKLIKENNMKSEEYIILLQNIHRYDNSFIQPEYRQNQKKFILDVMDKLNYICNPAPYISEQIHIEKDMKSIGVKSRSLTDSLDCSTSHFFFKELRIKILYINKSGYVKMKFHNFLLKQGYEKRSESLISEMNNCLMFYHICPTLKNSRPCDISKVKHSEIVYFKTV